MKFSLILATYGREDHIRNFLTSLENQNHKDFEVIVVDQNDHSFVKKICDKYANKFKINYLKAPKPGLSMARNIGLEFAKGDIISFPDDDCFYPLTLLDQVVLFFKKNKNIGILSTATRDPQTKKLLSYTPLEKDVKITANNIFHTVTSIGLFINVNRLSNEALSTIFFDERLGLGAEFGSSEEMDYIHQYLNHGVVAFYDPSMYVCHPFFKEKFDDNYFSKIFRNSRGHGAFLKKNTSFKKPSSIYKSIELLLLRPIAGCICSIFLGKKNNIYKYFLILKGRINGFINY